MIEWVPEGKTVEQKYDRAIVITLGERKGRIFGRTTHSFCTRKTCQSKMQVIFKEQVDSSARTTFVSTRSRSVRIIYVLRSRKYSGDNTSSICGRDKSINDRLLDKGDK